MQNKLSDKTSDIHSNKKVCIVTLISWLSMVGFDFFLHAGLLAKIYMKNSLFLLPLQQSFKLIPLGYLSFLLLAILAMWLILKLKIKEWLDGLKFGLVLGTLTWGSFTLGLLSISTADISLLIGWFLGQVVELCIGSFVIVIGLSSNRLMPLFLKVMLFVLIMIIVTVILQSIGFAPSFKL